MYTVPRKGTVPLRRWLNRPTDRPIDRPTGIHRRTQLDDRYKYPAIALVPSVRFNYLTQCTVGDYQQRYRIGEESTKQQRHPRQKRPRKAQANLIRQRPVLSRQVGSKRNNAGNIGRGIRWHPASRSFGGSVGQNRSESIRIGLSPSKIDRNGSRSVGRKRSKSVDNGRSETNQNRSNSILTGRSVGRSVGRSER